MADSSEQAYAGLQSIGAGLSDFAQWDFIVRSILNRTATATLVQVKAVVNEGGVEPVGFVDVNPLVAQVDGFGKPTVHGIINNVPYFRLQGGVNAVIMDPAVDDIGIAIFASHDISSVKANKAASNPGSRRRFSMADALYIGGVLNGTPENYIRFDSEGEIFLKPASLVTIEGDLSVTGTVTADVDVIADGVSLKDHTHSGVDSGPDDTGPPN